LLFRFRVPYSADPLIDLDAGTSADEVSIARIMQRYAARNCKCTLLSTPSSSLGRLKR
jgi:hypothetical protein